MKKLIITIMGLSLFGTGALAGGLGVFGSYWDPDDGDETLGVGAKLRGGSGPIYGSIRCTYYDDITQDTGPFDNDVQAIPVDVGAGLQMDLTEVANIYGGVGGSYFFLDSDQGSVDDEFGWYLEAGAELGLNEDLAVFAEAIWRSIEGTVDDPGSLLDDNDFDLDGIALNLGLALRW